MSITSPSLPFSAFSSFALSTPTHTSPVNTDMWYLPLASTVMKTDTTLRKALVSAAPDLVVALCHIASAAPALPSTRTSRWSRYVLLPAEGAPACMVFCRLMAWRACSHPICGLLSVNLVLRTASSFPSPLPLPLPSTRPHAQVDRL